MGTSRIIYPCYFDGSLSRAEGRRVSRKYTQKAAPKVQELERVVRRLGIAGAVIEPHSHPAQWFRREGRLVLEWKGSKEQLLRKIARKLSEKQ